MKRVLSGGAACVGMIFAISMSVVSCVKSPAERGPQGEGTISVGLSTDTQIGVLQTRAENQPIPGVSTAPTKSDYSLLIYADGGEMSNGTLYPDLNAYDPMTTHPVGSYIAVATCGDIEVEDFNNPVFVATQPFEIEKDEITPVQLQASMANMAVQVVYTDEFKGYFPERKATIMRNDAPVVVFGKDETRTAFVKPQAFTLKVEYTYQPTGKGTPKTDEREYEITENVGPRTLHKVTMEVNDGAVGGGKIVIKWNDEPLDIIDLGTIDVGETPAP